MSNRLSGDCSIPKFFVPYLTPADLAQRLAVYDRTLYLAAKEVLEENKAQRHIRGGIATRKKYRGE